VSLTRSLIGSRRSSANALVTPRLASRSGTAAHHAVLVDAAADGPRVRERFAVLGFVPLLPAWMRWSAGTTLQGELVAMVTHYLKG
jgi:hypothetical protein